MNDSIILHHGDCKEVLRGLNESSVDSVVTDPPYGLSKEPNIVEVLTHWMKGDDYKSSGGGFMGKSWDSFVPGPATWKEVFRVLKPGGHLLCFAGSRTVDLMGISLRMAGFEIRDQIQWVYAQGFPKGQDVAYEMHKRAQQEAKHDVRFVRKTYLSTPVVACKECGQVLFKVLPEQGAQTDWRSWTESKTAGSKQSFVEGWSYLETPERELSRCEVCTMSHGILVDGEEGRVHSGTPVGHGAEARSITDQKRGGTSSQSQTLGQSTGKSDAVLIERRAQAYRGFNVSLKPAHEPIIVARKPLVGTVAANVLQFGTGALNIDGCRVGDEVRFNPPAGNVAGGNSLNMSAVGMPRDAEGRTALGRWPANLIHDGSDEVLACFPDAPGQMAKASTDQTTRKKQNCYGDMPRGSDGSEPRIELDKSAARFFYCAKSSKSDRGEGNTHATVKPTDLMRYLCRLVTPPGGIVLDPFAGSGSTGKAALAEGFYSILIEQDANHITIIRDRLNLSVPKLSFL